MPSRVPCATVIMAVDHFMLPRMFRISRPLTRCRPGRRPASINVPAVVALLGAVFFGVTGTANWPNGWIYASEPNGWGPVPVEAWALSGILYVVGVAVARSIVPTSATFSRFRATCATRSPVRTGGGHRLDHISGRARSSNGLVDGGGAESMISCVVIFLIISSSIFVF